MIPQLLVEACHLRRDYGRLRAVDDLSIRLRRGEILGLLGPNGAGKSTTLQLLAGTLSPTAGTVRIDGVDLLDHPASAKAKIGFLPERPPLYRDLTVNECLTYGARLHRVPGKRVRAAVARARERCGLDSVGRRLIGSLSQGFLQRAGIALAVVHDPALVILDEPTTGLDPLQIRDIRLLIREIAEEQGVILSSHILSEVETLCHRVQILVGGRCVFDGDQPGTADVDGGGDYRLGFHRAPACEALAALESVARVEPLPDGRFRVSFRPGSGPQSLVEASVEQAWGLTELSPEASSLEQTFTRLVYREGAPL